jgi:hypothetical protein
MTEEEPGMAKVIKRLLDDAKDRKSQRQRMLLKYRGRSEDDDQINIQCMDIKNFCCSSSPPIVVNLIH